MEFRELSIEIRAFTAQRFAASALPNVFSLDVVPSVAIRIIMVHR